MRDKIEFFVKLLGAAKAEQILEDYVTKTFRSSEGIVVRAGRPLGSKNQIKKKVFPNGMHYWTPAEETKLVELEVTLRKEGFRGRKLWREIGKEFGVTGGAAHNRWGIVTKRYGNKSIPTVGAGVSG